MVVSRNAVPLCRMSFQEREEIGYDGIITIQAGYLFQLDLDDLLFILEEHVSDESLCHDEILFLTGILYPVCKILLYVEHGSQHLYAYVYLFGYCFKYGSIMIAIGCYDNIIDIIRYDEP